MNCLDLIFSLHLILPEHLASQITWGSDCCLGSYSQQVSVITMEVRWNHAQKSPLRLEEGAIFTEPDFCRLLISVVPTRPVSIALPDKTKSSTKMVLQWCPNCADRHDNPQPQVMAFPVCTIVPHLCGLCGYVGHYARYCEQFSMVVNSFAFVNQHIALTTIGRLPTPPPQDASSAEFQRFSQKNSAVRLNGPVDVNDSHEEEQSATGRTSRLGTRTSVTGAQIILEGGLSRLEGFTMASSSIGNDRLRSNPDEPHATRPISTRRGTRVSFCGLPDGAETEELSVRQVSIPEARKEAGKVPARL